MRHRTLRISAVLTLLAMALIAPAGCNTVEGAGRDLEAVGEGISDAASELKPGN